MNNIEVRNEIKKYKELKADIVDINIRIAEMERECIGISAIPQGERISPTYKITSSVENQAEKHMEKIEKLLHLRFVKENKIKRINNALTVLDSIHKDIVEEVLINNKGYQYMQEKLYLSYRRVKQLECEAIDKMKKYIL